MKIFIDDQVWKNLGVDFPVRLAELLDAIQDDEEFPADRVAVAVEVDDKRWDPMDPGFEDVELERDSAGVVRVVTTGVEELLMESIGDATAAFQVIADASAESARRFRVDSLSDALQYFVQLMDRIRMTMEFWTELRGHLSVVFADEIPPLDALQERLRGALNEAMEFQKDSDWVMLADTSEHELSDIFSQFQDRLEKLRKRAASRA